MNILQRLHIVIISHKECWKSQDSLSGYSTNGGFPFQMRAISELFAKTTLVTTLRESNLPVSLTPLTGTNLFVKPLPEPKGKNIIRKLSIMCWLPSYFPRLWHEIRLADVVHALVPGDIGLIGLLVALLQKKRLFVRHCGTWGKSQTIFDRFTFWLLEKIAGGKNVVFATGGGDDSPSSKNENIKWIFSTTLSKDEFASIKGAFPWKENTALNLVSVARLFPQKNIMAIVESLPILIEKELDPHLSIVGDGPERERMEAKAEQLNISDRVIFWGNLPHQKVLEVLSASNLFVFPTRVNEGFPKALLEAMACGLPIVASSVSVIPYLIRESGILLPGTDPGSIAAAILELSADPELMYRMGFNARHVSESYTLENWREKIQVELESAWGRKC